MGAVSQAERHLPQEGLVSGSFSFGTGAAFAFPRPDHTFPSTPHPPPHPTPRIYRHFPQLSALIKGGEKITYAPELQQQRLGFSFQSKQQGGLIQMLIAGPKLATKRGRHFSLQMPTRPLLRPRTRGLRPVIRL